MVMLRSRVSILVWLRPGVRLKRWLLVALCALVICSLGIGLVFADIYKVQPFPEIVYYITLQFVHRLIRGLLLLAVGLGLGAFAMYRLSQALLAIMLPGAENAVEVTTQHEQLQAGPRVVAIGGGTGLSTLLQGLKEITANVTAIVTVGDDGGSSGRLRRQLGILPPGDFRQCLVALSDAEPLMAKMLQHRFSQVGDLAGHSFGNIFLTALTEITGSFETALQECCRVLAVRGRVVPVTLADVTVCAQLEDGRVVRGESAIGHAGSPIRRVFLDPAEASPHPDAVQAILDADVIIVGPGSLYTSILPPLLVGGLGEALRASKAHKVYVCNVATEAGETSGFTVADFVRAIQEHVGDVDFDSVLVNDNYGAAPSDGPVELVQMDRDGLFEGQLRVLSADVISEANPLRHDPHKLAGAIAGFMR